MTILLEKAMDSAKVRAETAGAGNADRLLSNPLMEPAMKPNDGGNPPGADSATHALKMGHHHQQSKPKGPSPFAFARALEAAAARRREERAR